MAKDFDYYLVLSYDRYNYGVTFQAFNAIINIENHIDTSVCRDWLVMMFGYFLLHLPHVFGKNANHSTLISDKHINQFPALTPAHTNSKPAQQLVNVLVSYENKFSCGSYDKYLLYILYWEGLSAIDQLDSENIQTYGKCCIKFSTLTYVYQHFNKLYLQNNLEIFIIFINLIKFSSILTKSKSFYR
ncbi:hypothetical protein AGLY_000747 [Aphis glycines]|uniref:Uncharacterized protein n=1 Tax=Aphis glycines TaxID=307491 RepID=A0A6G0U802_APHGL|nr:hypothetical protein AGLY_000747 [Aphis glycines]